MNIAHADTTDWSPPRTVRGGLIRFKCMLEGQEGSPNNFSLVIADTDVSFKSPRHRHNFDQLRITLSGSTNFGPRHNIEVGDIAYFPEGTHYGPQDQALVGASSLAMVLQFGGASGNGYMSQRQLLQAQRQLEAGGRFEDGVYRREGTAQGERRNQDAYEAIWEHHNGRALEYPRPRMTEPVHFRANNVPWHAVQDAGGVFLKDLGEFSERHVRIGCIRLELGAQFTLPAIGQQRILFFTEGAGEIGEGGSWKPHSAIHLAADEAPLLRARETSEALLLALPRFDGGGR
jgi:hypothetical protein